MTVRARRLAILLAPLCLAACHADLLDPQGPVSSAERSILIDSMAIMLAIVVPTIVGALGVGWWFRKSNGRARHLPDWAYSGQIELIVWGIPILVITLLGGVAWISSHQLDPAQPIASTTPAIQVQGVSLDWKWLFIYPDQHIASVNELVVPAGVPIHFSLTSGSVMNAFFVPQLGSMIYTMNGMATQLNLRADKPGDFMGLSTHYSGDGFSDMHFQMRAVPVDQFESWVANTRKAGPVLDSASYANLAKQSVPAAPFEFRDVEQGLFQKVVSQQLAPGPGPVDQAGIDVSSEAKK